MQLMVSWMSVSFNFYLEHVPWPHLAVSEGKKYILLTVCRIISGH